MSAVWSADSNPLSRSASTGPRSLALRIGAEIKRLTKPKKESLVAAEPGLNRRLELLGLGLPREKDVRKRADCKGGKR